MRLFFIVPLLTRRGLCLSMGALHFWLIKSDRLNFMTTTPTAHEVAPLFEPFNCKRLTVSNRLVMAPMTRAHSPGGVPGEDVAAYYRRKAESGVGLIITEGTWIPHPAAANDANVPRFYGDDALAGWQRVVKEVHAAGGRIMPQIWHVGLCRSLRAPGDTSVEDLSGKVSPSGYVMPNEKVSEGMTAAEIEAVIDAYATAAETAEKLGFDGAEIHGAHGYLVDQFFWHETNRRNDRWGGKDLAARAAFGVDVVRACRSRISKDFPLALRFSQVKTQDLGARMAETPQQLEQLLLPLAEAGVDIFHASQRRFWEPAFDDSDLNLAGWAKRITGKATITVGSVGLAKDMGDSMLGGETHAARVDKVIEMLVRGDFDLVAVGRALLADSNWVNKIRRNDVPALTPFTPMVLAQWA